MEGRHEINVANSYVIFRYAAEPEVGNASNVAQGHGGMGGAVKESTEMSGRGSMTTRDSNGT